MSGLRIRHILATAGPLAVALAMSACSSPKANPAPPPALQLWGDMKPIVSVKELMRDMLDPIADNIFDAVSIVVDKKGTVETVPKTEDDWERIRIGGTTLAEGA